MLRCGSIRNSPPFYGRGLAKRKNGDRAGAGCRLGGRQGDPAGHREEFASTASMMTPATSSRPGLVHAIPVGKAPPDAAKLESAERHFQRAIALPAGQASQSVSPQQPPAEDAHDDAHIMAHA